MAYPYRKLIKPRLGTPIIKGHRLGPAGGLVFFLLMNECSGDKVFDLSGNNFIGTFQGTAPSWTSDKFGSAVLLPGTDEHILVGDYDYFSFTDGSTDKPFSVVAWVKPTAIGSNTHPIVSKYLDISPWNGEWMFSHPSTGANLYFQCADGSPVVRIKITSSFTFSANVSYQVAATYDGSGSQNGLNLYKNGIVDASPTRAMDGSYSHMDNMSCPLEIGSGLRNSEFISFYQGIIDCVMIYNRALSISEMARLYREPFCMFDYEPIELWTAATQGGAAPPVGKTGAKYVPYGSLGVQTFAA